MRWHFETKHHIYPKLNLYEKCITEPILMINLDKEQRFFEVANTEISTVTRFSFENSKEIIATGKSFTEWNFKKCMLITMSRLCPEEGSGYIPEC